MILAGLQKNGHDQLSLTTAAVLDACYSKECKV